jgi:DNA-directed DNA polymerase III PolC
LDADAFFAAVEQAADPRLRGRPVAVGGERRGIIASASYEARKFGVYTPMPTARARKLCPHLVVLPGDFERYEQFSNWMFGYCYDFTPDVERTSIDEGYLDLTANRKRTATEIALTIRRAIRQSLKITVSEGIGSNKLVSQIASKLLKPAAFQLVPAGREREFLDPLANRWLPGVGPKTARRLNLAGLAEIRHIAATPIEMLELALGAQARVLQQFSRGIDERPLVPAREPAKSFGQQETFNEDLTDEAYAEATLRRMADHLFAKVRQEGKSIRTLAVKVRYNDMGEDQAGESLAEPTDLETDVYGRLRALLRRAWRRRVSLRMVSLKLSNVYEGLFRIELPLEQESSRHEARQRLAKVVDALRQERGAAVILRGHDFRLRHPPEACYCRLAPKAFGVDRLADCRLGEGHGSAGASPYQGGPVVTDHGRLGEDAAAYVPLRVHSDRTDRTGRTDAPSAAAYVPLRVHSHYSFLDSTLSPAGIVALAKQHGLPSVALTDTGNLHGAAEFVLAAKEAGVKPILGAELRAGGGPLLLYVESAPGYHNLCRLLTRHGERTDGDSLETSGAARQRPTTNHDSPTTNPDSGEMSVAARQRSPIRPEELEGGTEGLIAVSGDARLARYFPGRFYQLAARDCAGDFPSAACPAIHHAAGDRLKYDIVASIRTLTLLRQAHPEKPAGGRLHFRAPEEMRAACRPRPEWLRHTLEIAERCDFDLPFGQPQFPAFHPPDGSAPGEFLRRLTLQGLRARYGTRANRFQPQAMEELDIINEVGYEEYFLITHDLLQECRARGIEWITRGSAADSLVCYCLGISGVCPVRFDLYFRRFLNRERMALHKLPDIDIDFAHDRKDDVVRLVFEKYGREHCAVVGGFSTFQARSAFAEAAKVLGVAEREVRKFTEHFPWGFGGGWVPEEAAPKSGAGFIGLLRANPETRDLPFDEEPYRTALDMAGFLDGAPRHPKMHPCGLVLSRQPMCELTPTFISNKGYATTHFDMNAVEAIGLVKMDLLAQGGLAVMRDARSALDRRGITVDLDRCAAREQATGRWLLGGETGLGASLCCDRPAPEPWGDPAVWKMIADGGARAVHHIESPAMISLCRMTNVREIDGLIAIVSVIRPGAANEGKKLAFTRRYQGLEPVAYPHPSLENCLRSTYGLVVYEEHILQLCEAFAGLTPGRADVLRRALAKQKRAVIEEIRGEFFQSALGRGHSPEKTAEVWGLASGFAGYAFCKAHSTAYGVEAYQSAWLKRYFPAEFMAAVLTNGKGFYHPLVYILECHRLGLKLLPPSVNRPGPEFGVEEGAIRVPCARVKGLTERTTERLVEERGRGAFGSLGDFYRRVGPAPEEIEAMTRAGAFDEFGQTRTAQFWEAQHLGRAFGGQKRPGQGWLLPPPGLEQAPEIPLKEPDRLERLQWETELLGFPASGHPLELHENIAWDTYCPVSQLGDHVGREVVACGLVIEQRTHHQITGEPMKFLTLADRTGMVETELFARTYRSYGLATVRYPVLEIAGKVEPFENGRGFSLRVRRAGKPRELPRRD